MEPPHNADFGTHMDSKDVASVRLHGGSHRPLPVPFCEQHGQRVHSAGQAAALSDGVEQGHGSICLP